MVLAVVAGLSPARLEAQKSRGSLLLPGPVLPERARVEWDPWLPTGARRSRGQRPESRAGEPPACSFRLPVCVHRGNKVPETLATSALNALEVAYERLVLALRLPAPLGDGVAGGDGALDLYLVEEGPTEALLEPGPVGTSDRSPVFCVTSASVQPEIQRAATRCVAEAIAARLDAAETPGVRRAYGLHLWLAVGEPAPSDFATIEAAQVHPEVAPIGESLANDGAAALFLDTLDTVHGVSGPGTLTTSMLALSAGHSPPGALTWDNEPDFFDVVRRNLGESPAQMAHLLGDFSVRRAFLGSRDDGLHMPWLAFSGDHGRIRFDWNLRASALPRRVASLHPIEPLGSFYAWLELDDLSLHATLGFQAEWEPPVAFQWNLVRVARDGRELSRVEVPFQQRATTVEQRITNLESAAGVLIVGTNLGGITLAHPFDPDVAPFEPHGCTVYLAPL